MNSTAPSSSAFAHTGWNLGSEKSSPNTLPPIAAPRRPCFFIAVSSCCTARSGYCRASEAKAANRSGREVHNSASFSFLDLDDLGGGVAVLAIGKNGYARHIATGRLRLVINPRLLGSLESLKTIGIVELPAFAAKTR